MVGTSLWLDRANPLIRYIYYLFDSATHLSLIPQQWSHSSQESSAKLQSIAETGNLAVVYKEHYDPNTHFSRHLAGSKPYAAGCFSCHKWLPGIAGINSCTLEQTFSAPKSRPT